MTKISKLALALSEVPDLLLNVAYSRQRDDALASLGEIDELEPDPSVIVVIGGGGSGKSSVVNALVGEDVAAVSPVRPTTISASAIGRSGTSRLESVADHVHTDLLRDGIVVVDTPSWDYDRETVLTLAATAHTILVVLTAARYGDAVASEIVRGLPDRARVVIVANRMPTDPDENEDVLDDIESTFDVAVPIQIVEGEPVEIPPFLMSEVPVDTAIFEAKRLHERAAADAGRRIARAVASFAMELGGVERALTETAVPACRLDAVSGGRDWATTRGALVDVAIAVCGSLDDRIIEGSDNALAERIRESLTLPDAASLGSALDSWRQSTAKAFRKQSKARWRQAVIFELLDRWSWVLAIDPNAKAPRRIRRAMRGNLDATGEQAREDLCSTLDSIVHSRSAEWELAVARIGDYRPGVLFMASDELDGGESTDA